MTSRRERHGPLLAASGGKCNVCQRFKPAGGLVIDHNHDTGLIRGVLCVRCNKVADYSTEARFVRYRNNPPAVGLVGEMPYKEPRRAPAISNVEPVEPRDPTCDPVGFEEIAARLHVQSRTVQMWRYRGLLPPADGTISGRPFWFWPIVEQWAEQTGRL